MGLTNRKLQTQIAKIEAPHYFEVRDSTGERVCHCGSERDAIAACERNWAYDYTYVKVYFSPPKTVDVKAISVDEPLALPTVKIKGQEIPLQQNLSQSELKELEL
jgi:hypothetical protein